MPLKVLEVPDDEDVNVVDDEEDEDDDEEEEEDDDDCSNPEPLAEVLELVSVVVFFFQSN